MCKQRPNGRNSIPPEVSRKTSAMAENVHRILSTPEEILWRLAEQEIFVELREKFKEHEQNHRNRDKHLTTPIIDVGIDKEAFLQIITTILGNENVPESLVLDLFSRIDSQENERIVWDNFLDFNLKALQPKGETPLQLGETTYHQHKECKRDPIVKIVLLESDLYFSYAILAKHGKISVMDAECKHLTSYQAIMSREDQFRSQKEARKRYRWLTDAVFLPDVNMFVVANSTRSMTIYDASGLKHVPVWFISGFPNIIQVLLYNSPENDKNRAKSLILGTDNGEIALVTFHKPKDDFLPKKHQDKLSHYYFLELGEYKEYIQYKTIGKFFSNPVVALQLTEDRKSVVACSRDRKKSLIMFNIDTRQVSHCISTESGINCFVASCKKRLIITGSDDGVVRVWSMYKQSSALETKSEDPKNTKKSRTKGEEPLEGILVSKTGVVDVVILELLDMFVCTSRNAELKFYDLNEYKYLQNVKLNFECFDIFTVKAPEWGAKCMFPGPKRLNMSQIWERNWLLVTCCNAYARIDLFYLDGQERHLREEFLPPQPLQNSVLIPQDWELSADATIARRSRTKDASGGKRTQISSTSDELDALWRNLVNLELRPKDKSEVHSKIALLEERKAKMRWAVEQGAPFLALELYECDEIQLPARLPIVENKRTRNIVDKTRNLLSDAASQTIVFSDISSARTSRSSTRSSKSSKASRRSSVSSNGGRLSRLSTRSSILEFQ